MKLKCFQIKNFKCFTEKIDINIHDNLTCIVGKNETGKSAILEVLSAINSYFPKDVNFSVREHPLSKSISPLDKQFVLCKFDIYQYDIEKIIKNFGINILTMSEVEFYRNYDNKTYISTRSIITEEEYISRIKNKYNIINDSIVNLMTLAGYVLSNIESDTSTFDFFQNLQIFKAIPYSTFINEILIKKMLPPFLYLNDNYLLENEYSINSLRSNRGSDKLQKNESLIINLIEQNGENIDLFLNDNNNSRARKSYLLKQLSETISSESKKQKDIGDGLSIDISYQGPNSKKGVTDTEIHISINDTVTPGIEYNLRSSGVKYFVSLMAWFTLLKDKDVILLLDEPGTGLHASAQFELLEVIKKLNCQTIYTTHSPFMIDKYEINSVVTLEKSKEGIISVSKSNIDSGNKSCMPLMAALGYSLNQGLFFSDFYIIVEGFSDLCYFNLMNKYLDYPLDKKWHIVPAGSDSKISQWLQLLKTNKLNAIVVCDKGSNNQVVDNLKKEHEDAIIIQFNSVIDKDIADIEDLFGIENYIHLVGSMNGQDADIGGVDINGKSVSSVKCIIDNKNPNINQKHDDLAKHLFEVGFDKIGFPNPDLIKENYTTLFKLINKTLDEFKKPQESSQ